MTRVKIAEFGIIQKQLANAVVTFFLTDDEGVNTGVKATIYQAATGLSERSNPQTLDADGKLSADCYVDAAIMAAITGITERTERSIRKIRQNPIEFSLPVTSSNFASQASADLYGDLAAVQAAVDAVEAVLADAGFIAVSTDLLGADNIGTVASNISNVNAVAANEANINAVNADAVDIGIVATNIANVNLTGGSIGSVNTVAGIDANVNTVAGISADVTTVATNNANVSTVAGISAAVTTAAGIDTDITTVAGIAADVTTVANNMATITDAAANIPKANRTAVVDPTVNDDSGDGYSEASIWVNATSNKVFFCGDPAVGAAVWLDITPAGTFSTLTDVNLTGVANGDFLKYNGSDWINRTPTEARTDLGLAIGTNVQAYSAVLQNTTASFLTAQETKLGHITVTQAVDLDAIETRVNDLDASVILRGTWDASAGTFPGGGTAQAGASYIVSVGGTVDSVVFNVSDRIIAITDNASTTTYAANWFKADYTDLVSSVAGQTGVVTLAQADISGLTTASSPQFTGVNVGHATDSTITRVSAGVLAIEGNNIITSNITASTTVSGVVELATDAETKTGTDTARAVTPANLASTKEVQATQATTSGTTKNFTVTGAKRITLTPVGVSGNGTSNLLIQLGDSGGIETSGYLGAGSYAGPATAGSNFTTGFGCNGLIATNVLHGSITLTLVDAATNTWVCNGVLGGSNTAYTYQIAGSKSLSAAITTVRATWLNGTDAFDAGLIGCFVEY